MCCSWKASQQLENCHITDILKEKAGLLRSFELYLGVMSVAKKTGRACCCLKEEDHECLYLLGKGKRSWYLQLCFLSSPAGSVLIWWTFQTSCFWKLSFWIKLFDSESNHFGDL